MRIKAEISRITKVKVKGSPVGKIRKRNNIQDAEVKKGGVKRGSLMSHVLENEHSYGDLLKRDR